MKAKKFNVDRRVLGLVLLSGICLGLSQPFLIPTSLESVLGNHGVLGLLSLIGYAPIIYLLHGASKKHAFVLAFFASFIQFLITFYWLVIPMTEFGEMHIVPAAVVLALLSAVLSCYIGGAFLVAQYLKIRFDLPYALIVPSAVCAAEYLRNYGIFGGFPWGNIGYAITQMSVFLQTASLVGIYGVVFVVVLFNTLIADFAHMRFDFLKISKIKIGLFFGVILAMLGFGSYRLSNGFELQNKVVKVGLLQGNINQGIKNQSEMYSTEILQRYEQLQDSAVESGAELVVWPESAYPLSLAKSVKKIEPVKPGPKATVLGAVVYGNQEFHNAAIVLDENATVVSHYYKSHLVPFGEYVPWPFRRIASKVVPEMGAFMPGNEYKPTTIKFDGFDVNLGMTICYEGVFPEISRTLVDHGANLLVNLTNDAWYGVSSAPYQHLHMYRLRAVETGVSVVRATNTGVSAWIDAYGYVHEGTSLYEKTFVLADVPIIKKHTLYMSAGDIVAQIALLFVLFTLVLGLVGKDVFVRRIDPVEWVFGAFGLALAIWASWHFYEARRALDESAITKQTFVTVFGLMLLVAAWSGRKTAHRALIIASIVTIILSVLVGTLEGFEYFTMAVVSSVVLAVALLRSKAYK